MARPIDTDQAIRESGLRRTIPRSVVARALVLHPGHHTVGEIQRIIDTEFGDAAGMARSSVYRALEALEAAGLVQTIRATQEESQFEWAQEPHHHLICTACGHVKEVHLDAAETIEREASRAHGFETAVRHLALKGTCGACARHVQSSTSRPETKESAP